MNNPVEVLRFLDPDTESDFQPFVDSRSGFGSSKKWNRNTSSEVGGFTFRIGGSSGFTPQSNETHVPDVRNVRKLVLVGT